MTTTKPTQAAASITHNGQPIQCGNHPLKAHITFTQHEHTRTIDGHTTRFAEPPAITTRCTTCGRETHTNQFTVDNTYIERSWPL